MRRKLTPLAIAAAMLLLASNSSYSQQHDILISLSAGPAFTSASQKDYRQGNGYGLQADAFVPFYRKGWDGSVKGSGFTLGINAGINYTSLKNLQPDVEVIGGKYLVYNGITNISNSSFKKYSGSFSGIAGLQAQFAFGKFIISPIISTGYISVKQEGYSQTGSFSVNGQPLSKDLARQDAVNESGFLVKPQLKFGYTGSDRVQLYLGAAFTTGPQMEYTLHTLVPQGGFKEDNKYEVDQIKNGSYSESKSKSRYKTSEIHLGIGIGLGKSSRKKPRGKVTKPGDNGMLQASNADSTKNPLYNPSGMEATNPLAMALPGSPIGGIVVKGGKNPGGNLMVATSDSNGKFELNGLEVGAYQFNLTPGQNPGANEVTSVGTVRPGTKGSGATSSSYAAGRLSTDTTKNPLYEGSGNSGSNPMYEASARPGSPIGGIVVKGGKNPGGNMINLSVDKNGTIQFEVLEAGNYKFIIQTPENPNPGKQKKVKEKATSGLKDTLKTNV